VLPIIKDLQGDHGSASNYRGITISPIFSKVFVHTLRLLFQDHLVSSKWQSGYRKNSSTTHALYCLKETVNYYVANDSNVYCTFLDATKAFDRLVYSGLFLKVIRHGVPKLFLDVLIRREEAPL
jgi:hypothetical protein